jgi:hypothetical protein
MQFGHVPAIQVLATTHGVREVNSPIIALVDIRQSGSDAAFRHHGMSLAQKGLRNYSNFHASGRDFRGGPQACTTRSNCQDIVLVREIFGH